MMHDDASAGKTAATPPQATTNGPPMSRASASRVMREPAPTREDIHQQAAGERSRVATLKAMVITMGIVLAPFFALVFGLDIALGVLAAGLAFTTVVTLSGARRVNPALRTKLYFAAGLNAALFTAVLLVLVLKLTN